MRLLSTRLIISLIIGVTLVSLCTSYYQVMMLRRGMRRDLERRAEVLGESLASNVEHDLERDAKHTLQRTVQQFANREHLAGLAVYDPQGHPIAVTTNLQPLMESAPADRAAVAQRKSRRQRFSADGNRFHSYLCLAATSGRQTDRQSGDCS